MKALVIGAGIGGVSAAAALKQQGIECEIFEAVKAIKPVGAAISVWSNGVKCMNHLGMGSIMDRLGGPMHYVAYKDGINNSLMTQFSLSPLVEAVGERPCPVSRADLQEQMIDWWGKDSIQFGKRLESLEQNANGVTAYFTDGTSAHGDFVIAADGTHSKARKHVLGHDVERRYAGYVNWNGLVDVSDDIAPPNQWTMFVGEGKRVSVMPIANNRFYFFFDVPLPLGLDEDRTTVKQDLTGYFEGWASPVQTLIQAINPDTTNRIEIHDIEPFDQLVKGRIALLGDSAHSTTPDIGQGGCSALEDAVVLGQCFAKIKDIEAALKEYEAARRFRVKDLVLKARKRCDVTHGKDMSETLAWYDELKVESGEGIIDGLKKTILGGPLA
ncbi:FAD-dependent urate hydroxylase HpxO [Marinomonas mediterranea]|jgi:2-polyprenyl-6-methoxyphenol hydroxylase and related FAD-dependent oxidoreductases|uniref:FAD-dependent urate hydroxylase n=1 Tax=Marinomonas mediterranea (strain ATCC 700492 / JCM 21426 / NBRC 103028 / MMB-1) TaxID=717774 RepID=F2JXL8_MARM1|nr:FAD-dependent urate hydroxylase HpxO [Marinomonas mediterranea]ADZ93016.1 Zeaxanthin epoxidase [Marinomonas mediterranea MMB-1]WCN10927.1 FAD-dependent urate hydroxylase HpxO [Marinomonas mediterranea]WCN14989.1 FAD-dependent urate hydroxylase HpxO [Marinomonas mediterranea]WCN19033.1 FAD-dependent urate hydroxylase HpxO [Marinomonas mediterranea MMB-1]